MKSVPFISIICIALLSCSQQKAPPESGEAQESGSQVRVIREFHPNGRLKSSTEAIGNLRDGISRDYRSDGTLENEISYAKNRKHGPAKSYYSDGKTLKNEIPYTNGYRQGMAKWYYQSGALYRETPYSGDMIEGTRRTYYENGRLQAGLPYLKSQPGVGLKEYTQDGKLKEYSGRIRVTEEDRISMEGSFTLILSITDGTKNVEFYTGKLTEGKYWNEELKAVPTENGTGKIFYHIPRGSFKMETLNLVAKTKTSLGHTRILQEEYHLAVENKF